MRKDLDLVRERYVLREARAEANLALSNLALDGEWGWVQVYAASKRPYLDVSRRVPTGKQLEPMRPGTPEGGF